MAEDGSVFAQLVKRARLSIAVLATIGIDGLFVWAWAVLNENISGWMPVTQTTPVYQQWMVQAFQVLATVGTFIVLVCHVFADVVMLMRRVWPRD